MAEEIPRNKLFLDLIGTNVVHRNGKKKKNLNSVTMVDPVTEWFDTEEYNNKNKITFSNLVETTWLTRYPWPTGIIYGQGAELIGHEFKSPLLKNDTDYHPSQVHWVIQISMSYWK